MSELQNELDTLLNEEESLMGKCSRIQKELLEFGKHHRIAKARAYRGNNSDTVWFRDVEAKINSRNAELKVINVELQHKQRRIGRVKELLKKEKLADHSVTRSQLFVQVVKENLSADEYWHLWDIVEGRIMAQSADLVVE